MISIEDLDFIDPQASASTLLLGGVSTQVNASAITGYQFAYGNVSSYASGRQTLTLADVTTRVTNAPFFTSSSVQVSGTAVAQDGTQYSRTSVNVSSSSTYIRYS